MSGPDRSKLAPILSSGTTPMTVEQHIRIELLKLLHVHSKDEQSLIDRAAKLEAYVLTGRPTS